MFRSPSKPAARLALLVGSCIALIGAVVVFFVASELVVSAVTSGPYREHGDIERLQAGVAPLIERLQRYRESRDSYPETLESIGEKAPMTRFGPWEYDRYRDGQAFSLRIGDYRKNGFVLLWDSPPGEWYIDG